MRFPHPDRGTNYIGANFVPVELCTILHRAIGAPDVGAFVNSYGEPHTILWLAYPGAVHHTVGHPNLDANHPSNRHPDGQSDGVRRRCLRRERLRFYYPKRMLPARLLLVHLPDVLLRMGLHEFADHQRANRATNQQPDEPHSVPHFSDDSAIHWHSDRSAEFRHPDSCTYPFTHPMARPLRCALDAPFGWHGLRYLAQ